MHPEKSMLEKSKLEKSKSLRLKADLALLLITIGWGSSFILTKNALADLATFNFLSLRFLLAFAISGVIFWKKLLRADIKTYKAGAIVGTVLFLGYAFQTLGLTTTTASNSAFITGFSVILVPLLSALVFRSKVPWYATLGTFMALGGLGLLTLGDQFQLGIGDALTLICTFAFASHIILVGHLTKDVDSIVLGVVQIGVVGILSTLASFLFETPTIPMEIGVWTNLTILAVLCTAGAFIVQSVAQQYTTATHTALIYTGEPVFAAVFAYFMVGEVLSSRGLVGAVLVVMGMLTAEL